MINNFSIKSLLTFSIVIYGLITISSCNKDEKGVDNIESYFKEKNISPQITDDGLYYIIQNPGNSERANLLSTVRLKYKGYLQTDKLFDDNKGEVAEFNLSETVPGFKRGLLLLGEGGKATIYMPSYLGYGQQERPSIPSGSSLIFDIELLEIK
ncbi:MAG: hypothetical protein RLZZ546_2768 [Bacteroidota bacterium]|jgi:FKBP-type peptidyl-prolyl cis-trans isomerase FkpA